MSQAVGQNLTLQQALELGLEHHHARRFREAEQIYRQILQHHPTHPDALHLLGLIAHIHGRNDHALDLVGRATQLGPTVAPFWNTLGEVNRVLGRLDTAYHCYQKALRYQPDMPEAHNNLGILFAYRNDIQQSVHHFERALALRPNYPEAHDGLGLTLLMDGQLQRGWTEQEWRWRKDVLAGVRRNFSQPQWRGKAGGGEELGGRTILVHSEQGFGDMIQFCRYIPLLRAAEPRARILFEVVPEVAALMRSLGGFDELLVKTGPGEDHLPPFDVHSPLMSLPLAMGTTLETIPAKTPYLWADREKVAHWQRQLDRLGDGLKVGIAWAGRPSHPRDAGRSMRLEQFAEFAGVPGVKLVSLQKGEATRQIEPFGRHIAYNAGPELEDFSDTAALVTALDLVIAVDTSLVHLAGALGKPFFVLLPFSPDWRWLLGRSDSPWYPTARLFRQQIDTVWDTPLAEARAALAELAAKRP